MAHSFYPYAEYTKFDGNWLFETPAHWQTIPLKYLCSFYGGGTPSKDNLAFWKGDIPWVSPKDMKTQLLCDTEDHITETAVENSSTQMIEEGSLLIVVRSGILQHTIPVTINKCSVALNQDMKGLSFDSRAMPEFVKYFIIGNQSDLLLDWRKQGATVESIEHEYLANSILPTPSIHEQRTIVAFLDHETAKIDTLIEKQQQLIKLLKEKRQAVISHAVTKGLNPDAPMKDSGVEWLGEVPEHWEVVRLKHLISVFEQGWSPQCDSHPASQDEFGVLKVGAVNYGVFNPLENKALPSELTPQLQYLIKKGDLLISRANTKDLVGSAAVVDGDYPNLILCDKLYRLQLKACSPYLVAFYLSTPLVRKQIELEATGASHSMQNIGQSTVRDLFMPLPPREESEAILSFLYKELEKYDAAVSKAETSIKLLQEKRSALISAAVTGKIDVRNWKPQTSADMQQKTITEPVATH